MQHITDVLRALELSDINPGTWSGSQSWSKQANGAIIDSINPATGKRLAQVRGATPEDYEDVMASAVAAAAAWRLVPAPKRGDFSLCLRAYWPKVEITDGSWTPPAVTRMN